MKITTDPAGASVREDSNELCAATPCDVTFKGDAADPSKLHKLVVAHAGYKPETKSVKPGDPLVHLKLVRGAGATVVRPAPPPPPPPPVKTSEPPPSGFKDLPY